MNEAMIEILSFACNFVFLPIQELVEELTMPVQCAVMLMGL